MQSYLRQIERLLGGLDEILSPAHRSSLEEALAPWLARYRESGGKDDEAYRKIVAIFRRFPEAFARFRVVAMPVAKARVMRRRLKKGGGGSGRGAAAPRPVRRSPLRSPAPRSSPPAPPRPAPRAAPRPPPPAARAEREPPRAAARPAVDDTSEARGDEGKPRWILANVYDSPRGKDPIPAFRAEAQNEIRVMIGAERTGWLVARGADDSESIDATLPQGTHRLTVVFFMPASGVRKRTALVLPPSGPTRQVGFRFRAGKAQTACTVLISVLHSGRVLQTAVLSGEAVDDPAAATKAQRVTLKLHVVTPRLDGLEHRQPFDAALIATKDPEGHVAAAGVTRPSAPRGLPAMVVFKQPRIDGAAAEIRDILAEVVGGEAAKRPLESNEATQLLWSLAQQGRILYEVIGERLEAALPGGDLSRLQLVQTDASVFIPIEFCYELPAPANKARLCANWKNALAGKPCGPKHHKVDALGHLEVVCPSGFWSVSKVIERQIVAESAATELAGKDFGLRAEPAAPMARLEPIKGALVAWSEVVDNSVAGTSRKVLAALEKATGDNAASVKTWLKWAEAIRAQSPGLLVLLSHTVANSLEIGAEDSGERATVAQINDRYVKRRAGDTPVVFLFGCDTAVNDEQIYSFVGRFRDQGAALVVGTITPVLGERSAAVVMAIVARLTTRRAQPVRFGELMREARRELLAGGELTALCATSFGDATWLVA